MDLKVLGKSALITGSSRGLGFAIALKLAEEGCKIAINGRSEENLLRAAEEIRGRTGTSVGIIPGDVTDSQFPKELIQKTIGLYGGLDLLVTNAGGPPAGSFESFDDDTWQHAVDLSFLSHMRVRVRWGRHSVQFHLARLDQNRKGYRIIELQSQNKQHNCRRRNPETSIEQPPWTNGFSRGISQCCCFSALTGCKLYYRRNAHGRRRYVQRDLLED